jgi:hypothetical protein
MLETLLMASLRSEQAGATVKQSARVRPSSAVKTWGRCEMARLRRLRLVIEHQWK